MEYALNEPVPDTIESKSFYLELLNMEPPDGFWKGLQMSDQHVYIPLICNSPNTGQIMQYGLIEICVIPNTSIRVRGGMDNPKDDDKTDEIPSLKNKRFSWDGLPRLDFIEVIQQPLENGLATIMIKGWSLLDAGRRRDAGGVFGNPSRLVAPQHTIDESVSRSKKLFACIMNYISTQSYFYRMCMREFREDGITVLRIMPMFGVLTIPNVISKAWEDFWLRMSFETLRIPLDQKGWFFWATVVYEIGRKLGKNGDHIFQKYLDGWPMFMDSVRVKVNTTDDDTIKWGATWGDLYPGVPNAAQPHPFAGYYSPELTAKKYFGEYCAKSHRAKLENNNPLFVHVAWEALDECIDVSDFVNLLHYYDVTPQMICNVCGGKGHTASYVDKNGDRQECPTRMLEKLRNGSLGSSSSDKKPDRSKHLKSIETDLSTLVSRVEKIEAAEFSSRFRRRSDKKTAHATTDTHTTEDVEASELEDDDSSEGSHIQDMADAVQPSARGRSKRPSSPHPRRN